MPNPLTTLFQGGTYNPQAGGTFNPQAGIAINPQGGTYNPQTNTQTLPNGGGVYNPQVAGGAINPAPVFSGAPATPTATTTPAVDLYAKYRDPKTGEVMTPQEYAIYLGNKIPKGTGDITNYAGDAMTNPDQTAGELTNRARDLNTARNDIATGTTDPYKVGTKSGIAYSPAELKAIENAYAGVYDPAIKDVFTRLQEKKDEEAKIAAREEEIFKTNENIRQWRATTGTTKGSKAGNTVEDMFSDTQLNTAARNAGVGLEAIRDMDIDLVNFWVNPPMAKNDEDETVPIYQNFNEDFERVAAGDLDPDELTESISNSRLSPAVKTYFIEQIPMAPEKKDGVLKQIWTFLTTK